MVWQSEGNMIDLERLNETDIREDFAMPLITALGYATQTSNDILREQNLTIKYPHIFLGRKNPKKDPIIRGKPDYTLNVTGVCRWVLEIKSPSEKIDRDAIEQATSYARHPEVSGVYAAIMNGREFVLYYANKPIEEGPVFHLDTCDVDALTSRLQNILSPEAIRRDWTPPKLDTGVPLAKGFGSEEIITKGEITHLGAEWFGPFMDIIPANEKEKLYDAGRRFSGMKVSISEGRVWRDEDGRIIAKLKWNAPHEMIQDFAVSKGMFDAQYVALSDEISTDENMPTTFEVFGGVSVKAGEKLFDIMEWKEATAQIPMIISYRGQAIGHLDGREFKGVFQSEQQMFFGPLIQGQEAGLSMLTGGAFCVTIG